MRGVGNDGPGLNRARERHSKIPDRMRCRPPIPMLSILAWNRGPGSKVAGAVVFRSGLRLDFL